MDLRSGARKRNQIIGLVMTAGLALAAARTSAATPLPPSVAPSVPATAFNHASSVWMLVSTALVMLMVPGLAIFYGGMVRRKNILATMMHSYVALAVVGLVWVVLGYTLAFGHDYAGIIGFTPGQIMLWHVLPGSSINPSGHAAIPLYLFIMFEGMFAAITAAIVSGSIVERVRFGPYVVFLVLWTLLIYCPLAHWVWGSGWLGTAHGLGVMDFAGGTVVEIASGVSGLAMALYVGRRIGYPDNVLQPNSLVLTFFGAGILWFGWFGFNGGSAIAMDRSAVLAFTNTQIAAAAGAVAWLVADWIKHGRPTSISVASGLVAGMVAITPACGFVSPASALLIGAAAGVVCYSAVIIKNHFGYDDALDAFGVHGVGGFLGIVATGVLASRMMGSGSGLLYGNVHQFLIQCLAAVVAVAFCLLGTLLLALVIDKCIGLRVTSTDEIDGLDIAIHAEPGWNLSEVPAPAVELPGSISVDPIN